MLKYTRGLNILEKLEYINSKSILNIYTSLYILYNILILVVMVILLVIVI